VCGESTISVLSKVKSKSEKCYGRNNKENGFGKFGKWGFWRE
jgi:hypothetical protein